MQKRLFPNQFIRFIAPLAVFMVSAAASLAIVQPKAQAFDALAGDSYLPTSPPSPNTPISVGSSYILGVGDYLQVDVFNIPDYSGEFRVLSAGTVTIPIVGSIAVEGLSLQQATVEIERSLDAYVRRPNVTLSLLGTRPVQIAIAGEVHRPGAYRIAEGTSSSASANVPTLTEAIELAAGITQLADIRNIEIQRKRAARSPLVNKNQTTDFETISVNLWDLLKDGNLSEDLALQDGDRIIIPTASALNVDEVTQLAMASFSPDEVAINVVGEVGSPGNISVPPNTPLNQAILAAGGFNNRAYRGTVSLVRLNPNGTASQREIEVDFTQGVNEDLNPSLRPNDTVIVRRSGLASTSDTIGTIFNPFNFGRNLLRLFGM